MTQIKSEWIGIKEKYFFEKKSFRECPAYHIKLYSAVDLGSRSIEYTIININPRSSQTPSGSTHCYILTLAPAQKCYSKVIQRKEVTHSNGQ